MKIYTHYNLSRLNSFGVSAFAAFFVILEKEDDISELLASDIFKNNQKLFLGGGSNVLFTKDFDGIVILNKLQGIEIVSEDTERVLVRAMGGEIWHDLVEFAVGKGYWGIENLSLIPGTVGAAPMQNIGAYGVELKDVLETVEAYDIENDVKKVFTNAECEFGYRDSIFKNSLKGKYFISAITLKLSKRENKNINYKVLQDYIAEHKVEIKTAKDISDAVAAIRKSKLPDPAVLGNAGSFFKNVFLKQDEAQVFLEKYPDAPHFEEDNENKIVKIPVAWLIEQTGWKGKRIGNVGVHEKQALVLVNYGGAKGDEIINLAHTIIAEVKEKFGLELTPEVNLI